MANEYRIYQVNAGVVHDGATSAPLNIYSLNTGVIHSGAPTIQVYQVYVEAVRSIADRYDWAFIDDETTNPIPSGFHYEMIRYDWGFVDDPGEVDSDFTFINITTWKFIHSDEIFPFTMDLPPSVKTEWNPYRPDIPPQIAEDSPNTYNYLREQAENLREQHDVTQAGGTTFPWELMFQMSDEPKFQLGSLSRFYHPHYGIILARYVQYSPKYKGGFHVPVGRDLAYDDNVVTDDLASSHATQLMGVSLTFDQDPSSRYGWILVHGRGMVPLQVYSPANPIDFQLLTWTSNGYAGTGAGRVLGLLLDADAVQLVSNDNYAAPIGSWRCDMVGVTDEYIRQVTAADLATINTRLDGIDQTLAESLIDYQPQIDALSARATNLQNLIALESQQRAQVDNSFLQRIVLLEQEVAVVGPSTGDFATLSSEVTTIATTVTTTVGDIASLKTRVTSLESWQTTVNATLATLGPLDHVALLSDDGSLNLTQALYVLGPDGTYALVSGEVYSDVNIYDSPYWRSSRGRGTQAAPTAVAAADWLGSFSFYGHDGTSLVDAAEFTCIVTGAVSTGIVPTKVNMRVMDATGTLVDSFNAVPGGLEVPDEAYGAGWNGSLEVPTKNALYDKIESLGGGGSSDWITITFGSPGSVWGGTYKDSGAISISAGKYLEVEAIFDRINATSTCLIISGNSSTGYKIERQTDNNWVLYRLTSSGGASTLLSGGSLIQSGDLLERFVMGVGIEVSSGSKNQMVWTTNGMAQFKGVTIAASLVPLDGGSITIYATSDVVKARYRIVG